jgi:3-hydroxyisobutyrate dehydrogenase
MRVGFIGLGLMGSPMAQNIHKAGFDLIVYNRSEKRLAPFKKLEGVEIASSPKEVAEQSDVVITIVTGPKDVESVILGKNGVAEGFKGYKGVLDQPIIVDMSTIGPKAAVAIQKELKRKKIGFLDAPVTGGTKGATDGTLTIFVGGEEEQFKKLLPLFEAMGKNNLYIGKTGLGQAIKLVNNAIVGETLVALAEGFLLGEAMGLKRSDTAKFLENVPAVSPMMKTRFAKMIENDYAVTFSVANMYKDLDLALRENPNLPALKAIAKLYKKAMKDGLSELDNSAVLKVIK